MTENNTSFFRPEWTCGRYNAEHHAALFYNLIEGISYYFEDASADVIGRILQAGRNGMVSSQCVAHDLRIDEDSVNLFFEQLKSLNLLTVVVPTSEGIAEYRKQVCAYNCSQTLHAEKSTIEKLPMAISNAEMDYAERVGGVTGVMFELTYNCSEQCIHCYNPGATRNDSEENRRGQREEKNSILMITSVSLTNFTKKVWLKCVCLVAILSPNQLFGILFSTFMIRKSLLMFLQMDSESLIA